MRRSLVCLMLAIGLIGPAPSHAHRLPVSGGAPPGGVSIPSLTHGQMAVISENLSAIRALASTRTGFDLTLWRLEDYLNLESFVCLWGWAPGGIEDEDSPFNECAHAYLAAGRALLMQLNGVGGVDAKAVEALKRKIENEMATRGASLTLCRFSDEPFNTSQIIFPHGSGMLFYPPTAMAFAGLFGALGLIAWAAWPKRNAAAP